MRITFGSRTADCDGVPNEPTDLTWRGPTGPGVPSYISEPGVQPLLRRRRQAPSTTAPHDVSPAWMYPLEGNRDMAGGDVLAGDGTRHEGGDVWVTDVAFEVMDHERTGAGCC